MLLIDETSKIYILSFAPKFDDYRLKVSEPQTWFINTRVTYSPNWDFWLYGYANNISLEGQIFGFPNQIGFIMSIKKNRLNELFEDSNEFIPFNFIHL